MDITDLRRFNVYHPKGNRLNTQVEFEGFDYEYIGQVLAKNIEESIFASQNFLNPDYQKLGRRSTTIGDVISDGTQIVIVMREGLGVLRETSKLYDRIRKMDLDYPTTTINAVPFKL